MFATFVHFLLFCANRLATIGSVLLQAKQQSYLLPLLYNKVSDGDNLLDTNILIHQTFFEGCIDYLYPI